MRMLDMFLRGKIEVRINSASEWNEFLNFLTEKYSDIEWGSGDLVINKKHTEYYRDYESETVLVCSSGSLYYGQCSTCTQRLITTYNEFMQCMFPLTHEFTFEDVLFGAEHK